jgi:23S rRNA (adenine2503-C2)-methyltransferase
MKNSFLNYTYNELEKAFLEKEINPAAASLMFRHYYKEKKQTECQHHNLSKKAQNFIQENLSFGLPKISKVLFADDETVKFLFEFDDSLTVESVLIPFDGKYTLCVSTQVGCAMKCSFCFTGTQGLKRNLATEEIVGQFLQAWHWLQENRPNERIIKNIVYMGQGEPLHNFDTVKKASEIFLDDHGFSLGIQRITLSTAGYLPGLIRWNEEMPNINIALSLHSPFTEKRNQLIPINQRYPLEDILTYLDSVPLKKKQFITYEYLLIKNFNDGHDDALALAELLKNRKAIINLIPFNPFPGSHYEKPELKNVKIFKKTLEEFKIPTMIRTTKGDEILAACGQLNTK